MKKTIVGLVGLFVCVGLIVLVDRYGSWKSETLPYEEPSNPETGSVAWHTFDSPIFGISFRYPESMDVYKRIAVRFGDGNTIYITPDPQPIEFGPIMMITKDQLGDSDLLKIIQDKYEERLISYSNETINGHEWIRAVVKDSYLGEVVSDEFFTPFRKSEFLHVYYLPHNGESGRVFSEIFKSLQF